MEADVLTPVQKNLIGVVSFELERVSNGFRREDRGPASAGPDKRFFPLKFFG
jgi:hypothetical protein